MFRSVQPVRRIIAASSLAIALAGCAQGAKHGATLPSAPVTAPGEVGLTALATPIRPGIRLTELASLRDLGEQDLVGKLGKPDFMREDAAAEIWQYRSDACVLELFLYPSADGKLKVEHVVSHSRTRLDGPIDQCVPFGTSVASAS